MGNLDSMSCELQGTVDYMPHSLPLLFYEVVFIYKIFTAIIIHWESFVTQRLALPPVLTPCSVHCDLPARARALRCHINVPSFIASKDIGLFYKPLISFPFYVSTIYAHFFIPK